MFFYILFAFILSELIKIIIKPSNENLLSIITRVTLTSLAVTIFLVIFTTILGISSNNILIPIAIFSGHVFGWLQKHK